MTRFLSTLLAIALFICIMNSCQQDANDTVPAGEDTVGQKIEPAQKGYADVNGLQLYYEVYGKGKPVIFLHGSYMNIISNWSGIIPSFAKDRMVIVAEMQGHGRTKDTDRVLSYEAMADDVSGLLTHLAIDSADVVGYSMGGGIAFQLAVRHPAKVSRLVILSGVYAHNGWWPDVEASFSSITPKMFEGTPIQKQYDSLGNDPAKFSEFVNKVISIDLKPYDWSKEVMKIKSPLFMAIGDADGVKYEHALDLFRAKGGGKMGDLHGLPESRLAILPGTTHIGMMHRMDLLTPMISAFLDEDLKAPPPGF